MFRSLMVFALSVWLLTGVSGAAAAEQVQQPQRLSPGEQAGVKYLIQHADASGRGAVDLRDAQARGAYLAILAGHGITPATRPYLFKLLEKAAQQGGLGPVEASACRWPAADEGLSNYRTILDVEGTQGFTRVRASALDSLVSLGAVRPLNAPTYVQDTLNVYDSGFDNLLAQGESEGYVGDSQDPLDPRFNVIRTAWGNNPGGGAVAALATFYYRTKGNQAIVPCYIVIPGLDHFTPNDMKLIDPTNQKTRPGSSIVICANRQNESDGYNDCDYGPLMPGVGNDQAHVKAIVSGSIVYNDKVAPFKDGDPGTGKGANPDGEMAVVPRDIGGACGLSTIDGPEFRRRLKLVDGKTVGFSWGRMQDGSIASNDAADFGPLCWQLVPNNHTWDFVLTLKTATMNKNDVPSYSVLATYMSEGPFVPAGHPNIFLLPTLVFQFGCIMEHTKISMAGGRERPIEAVRIGDKVIGQNGAIYKVVKKMTGTDDEFIRIALRDHRTLSVTPAHPIAIGADSENGAGSEGTVRFVQAKDLVGTHGLNVVVGQGKRVPISKVTKQHLHRPVRVYNLTLEPTDAAAAASNASRPSFAFYANHVLVGDSAMQSRFIAERQAAAAQLPSREIGEEERVDYLNWRKSRLNAESHLAEPQTGAH